MNILSAGNPARKKLDALQSQITALQSQITAAEKSPASLSEAREAMRAALKREIEKDNPEFRLRQFRVRRSRSNARPDLPLMSYGLLAMTLGEEKLLGALMKPLVALDATQPGVDAAAHAKQLVEARSKLRDLEEQEERACIQLESDRWTVVRRGNCDPRLLLEIWFAHKPETVSSVPAEAFGFAKPRHVNEGAGAGAEDGDSNFRQDIGGAAKASDYLPSEGAGQARK